MPPDALHITSDDAYLALRQERDRWYNMAVELQQYIQQLEQQVIHLQNQLQTFHTAEETASSVPPENDYQKLATWLEAQKSLGNDYYADAGYNRSKMCRELRKILKWTPDQNSLRKAQNK